MNKTRGRENWDKMTLRLEVKGISQPGEHFPGPALGKGPKVPCRTPAVGCAGAVLGQLCPEPGKAGALEFPIVINY